MKKSEVVVSGILLLVLLLGCESPWQTDRSAKAEVKGDYHAHQVDEDLVPSVGDLIAGRSIKIGTITVTNDTDNLYVTYSLAVGWEMTESHLAVALSVDAIPQTKKHNPIPGQFPYKQSYDPGVTEYACAIPLAGSGFGSGDTLYLAAHAEVRNIGEPGNIVQEESAWAAGHEGEEFNGKNWATYFSYAVVTERILEGDFEILKVGDLAGYTGITGSLTIRGTDLPNLAWLTSLRSVGGDLYIEYNPYLASLDGLEGLTRIDGSLSIWDNPALSTLAALEGVTSIAGNLVIRDNPSLIDLSGLENLASVGASLFIIENSTLASLHTLHGLRSVGGTLSISSTTALADLNGLQGLTALGGYLDITNNYGLTSLHGLDNLTSVGGLVIAGYNGALVDLEGLEGLTSILGEVDVRYNSALTSFSGLDNLESVSGNFGVRYNDVLSSLAGLGSLDTITGNLEIAHNPDLPTGLANDFASGVSVGGLVTIEGNLP